MVFALLALGIVPLLTACTTVDLPRFDFSRVEPPFFKSNRSEEKREPAGRTEVIGVGFQPEVSVRLPLQEDAPRTSGGAKEGAKKGASVACGLALELGGFPVVGVPFIVFCAVAVVPAMAVGALAGALEDASQTRPGPAKQKLPPNELLPMLVARELALPDPGKALRMISAQDADYRSIAGPGLDSVLEISVRQISSEAMGNPDSIALTIDADARLVRARDNLLRWERSYAEKVELVLPRASDQATAAITATLAAIYPAIASRMADDFRSIQAIRTP